MSYLICPKCGQKALEVATRCPHCGLAFETQFFQHPPVGSKSRRKPVIYLIAGAVVIALAANELRERYSVVPPDVSPRAIVPAPRPEPRPQAPKDSITASGESHSNATPVPVPAPVPPAPTVESAAPAPPSPAAEPTGTVATQRLYASTWMNIRAGRSSSAPVLRILRPGEAVMVDLLEQGWYRVVTDGRGLGYVDRRLLEESPPAQP
jgi:hypothetical protein